MLGAALAAVAVAAVAANVPLCPVVRHSKGAEPYSMVVVSSGDPLLEEAAALCQQTAFSNVRPGRYLAASALQRRA